MKKKVEDGKNIHNEVFNTDSTPKPLSTGFQVRNRVAAMNQIGRKIDGLLKCWTTIVRFMKIPHTSLSLAGMILCCEIASGQGFVNLGFENTTLTRVLVNEYSGYYSTNATIPGWDWSPHANAGYSDPNTTVAFNDLALAASAVTLEGTNGPYRAISGKYSILLQGGSSFVSSASYASIGQTGQIPSSALSLIYWGGALQASFNGQPLAFYAMSNDPNFTVWGADISAYAGQTGQLLFTAPWQTTALLDNIQFSSSPVPEPSVFSLFICGTFLIFYRVTRPKTRIGNKFV